MAKALNRTAQDAPQGRPCNTRTTQGNTTHKPANTGGQWVLLGHWYVFFLSKDDGQVVRGHGKKIRNIHRVIA